MQSNTNNLGRKTFSKHVTTVEYRVHEMFELVGLYASDGSESDKI